MFNTVVIRGLKVKEYIETMQTLNQMLHRQSAYETYRVQVEQAIKMAEADPYLHDTIINKINRADEQLTRTLSVINKEIS